MEDLVISCQLLINLFKLIDTYVIVMHLIEDNITSSCYINKSANGTV